jgi:hypothetical protein
VIECATSTGLSIGISDTAATIGQPVEVQFPGGGAMALANGTITAGKMLVPAANGVQQTTGANDFIIAQALDSAVAGDIFAVQVIKGVAGAANQ